MKRSTSESPPYSSGTPEPAESANGPITPPSQKKSKPNSPTKSSPKKTTATAEQPGSARGQLLMAIFKRGMKGLDKAEMEELTGLKATQQKELLRMDGKGAVYNQVVKAAGQL